jgi:Co/Zn/Cd efflux system component
MADCCGCDVKFEGLSADYKRRLWIVIAINAGIFAVETAGGALAGSQGLHPPPPRAAERPRLNAS